MIRSLAMATAGESFNHLIQTTKKENHVLITHGIYKLLRHPSYVGFYYWSVGTQLLLGNFLHAAAFAVVSWVFFNRRIAYEEESLCLHFPHEYPAYVARSWMGIPFLFTKVEYTKTAMKDKQ
jgi:protein-S-isoprenylcysteine O-methyltransferase